MNSTIELTVRNKDIHVRKADKLVTGQTNNEIKFHFDGEPWNSLSKSIIFRVEDLKMLVALDGDTVKIPFEIFNEIYLGKIVYIGIYGLDSAGVVIYPTPYFRLGVIERGANTEGASDPSTPSLNIDKELLDKALKATDEAKTAAASAKVDANSAAESAATATKKAESASTDAARAEKAATEYPRIDEHGHWEKYDPSVGKWVDTGALAQFTIFRTYDSIADMYADWTNLHEEYYNNFVLIASEPKKNPSKDESIEDDNGKLFVILKEKNTSGNEYQQNGFSCVGDLSGAQGIQGESAYDIAHNKGQYKGSEIEFAALLTETVTNEKNRITAENNRVGAESKRIEEEGKRNTAETQRNSNEETRKKVEASRKEAEGLRASEEEKRKSSESERKTAEDSRVVAENVRNTSEDSRVKAENGRASAETARGTAESGRVNAEKSRVTAESGRVEAESNRVTTEGERVAAESIRAQKETERQTNETNRGKAENARVEAENARVTAENGRVAVEGNRVKAENDRINAENNRADAEETRAAQEETRHNNELSRINAENSRANNETERNNAETLRTSAEQIRINNEAARQSNEAIRRANEAAREVWENYIRDKTYYKGNKVALNGNSYVCSVESTTDVPGQTNSWILIAKKGDGLVIEDKYATLADLRNANPDHTYTYQVTAENNELFIYSEANSDWVSIGAIQGPKGDPGSKGEKGDKGETGETGATGATGATGPANVLSIGSVISGAAPSVTITGDSPNQVLNFVLQKGDKGEKGDKGDPGPQGERGPIGPIGNYTAGTGIKIENGTISATAEVYTAGDGISITNSSISARLGSGLKFDTEKKIVLDESVFVEYTDDEITNFYNTVTV